RLRAVPGGHGAWARAQRGRPLRAAAFRAPGPVRGGRRGQAVPAALPEPGERRGWSPGLSGAGWGSQQQVRARDSGQTSIRSSQWSFSSISSSTQRSYNACCSWTQHPLIQKNHRVVLASFLLLLLGLGPSRCPALKTQSLVSFPWRVSTQGAFSLGGGHHSSDLSHVGDRGWRSPPCHQLLPPAAPPSPSRLHLCAVLILTGVGLEVAPSPGVSSAIFFVPGFLLLVPGVYHVIFIYCAVKGHRGLPVLLPALLREVSNWR
uniref:Transmembrane protein 134 n=1 Tax=Bos taurus TaxID=9913 RepID=A0A452DJ18_BOVIN